ncbi:MAG: peptidase MA family metallohydrolase, partial [Dehalococcoidia bacterium]
MRSIRVAGASPRIVIAVACMLTLLVALPLVATAEGAVVVRASQAEVDFPRSVTFRLEAESATPITGVTLQVNTPGQRYGSAVRNVRPSFTAGPAVSATWTWPRMGNGLPPGAEITYRWRITDADGHVTETALESIRVEDDRYQWQELTEGPITVRWYKGGDAFGREIMAAAKESAARLAQLQGVDLHNPLTIHVYGSQPELFEAVPGAPGWIGGIAIPEFDTVMIGIEPSNLPWGRRALTHEIAHQLVYQMTAHPTLGSRVPTWLNEGLAVVAEGESEDRNRSLVDEAVASDTLPTLRALDAPFSA